MFLGQNPTDVSTWTDAIEKVGFGTVVAAVMIAFVGASIISIWFVVRSFAGWVRPHAEALIDAGKNTLISVKDNSERMTETLDGLMREQQHLRKQSADAFALGSRVGDALGAIAPPEKQTAVAPHVDAIKRIAARHESE